MLFKLLYLLIGWRLFDYGLEAISLYYFFSRSLFHLYSMKYVATWTIPSDHNLNAKQLQNFPAAKENKNLFFASLYAKRR